MKTCTKNLLLFVLLLALPTVVQAQFEYEIINGTVTITGYTGSGGAVVIPNTIGNLPVTSIGGYIFGQTPQYTIAVGVTSLTIGTNVTIIGDNAFSFNYSLTKVVIPNSVTSIGVEAFWNCSGLTNVTIPNSVTNIGAGAFQTTSLTNVMIPSSVTSVGNQAFADSSLTAITVDPNNPAFSSVAGVLFTKNKTTLVEYPGAETMNYMIPNSVTSIADFAFYGCLLTNVTIPDSVTNLGDYVFLDCLGLTNVTIGNGVTNIENHAFAGCSLTSVTIGTNVTSIGDYAFLENHILPSVFFQGNAPTNVASDAIGYTVGTGNSVQTTIYYLPGTSGWGSTFDGFRTFLWDPPFPFGYTVVNGTISIGDYFGSGGVVTIPSQIDGLSVTSIGAGAFADSTSLTGITIPNSVSSIGQEAFGDCYYLINVLIGNSVTSIQDYAFDSCTDLIGVYFQGNAPGAGANPFISDNKVTAYYLQGATGWEPTFPNTTVPTALWNPQTPLQVTTTLLPSGTNGVAYNQTIAASGGQAPIYSWSLVTGGLSPGMTLATSGLISGTPTVVGTSNFTVQVTDTLSNSATQALSLTISYAPLQITTTSLPNGTNSVVYSQTLTTTGGQTPYNWTNSFGALPPGLHLSTNGVISGTPATNGTFNFTVKVTDALSVTATQPLILTVLASNLVLNGGFETGNFSGWSRSGNTGDTSVTSGSTYAHSGTYGAQFGPSGSLGFISQTLATTAGTSYLLSCWLDSPDGETPNEFRVSWNGNTILDQINLPAIGWTNIQFAVTATGTSTVLQFGFRDDPSDLGFDDISVASLTTSPSPFILSTPIITVGKTNFTFLLSGPAGSNYVLQVSTNLLNWNPVSTSTIPVSGSITLSNAISGFKQSFFRVRFQ